MKHCHSPEASESLNIQSNWKTSSDNQLINISKNNDNKTCSSSEYSRFHNIHTGFPCGSAGKKKSACNAKGLGFNPWVGKIPWRRERLPTQVFWPGEVHGLYMGSQRVGHDWATFTHSQYLNWWFNLSLPPTFLYQFALYKMTALSDIKCCLFHLTMQ